MEQVHTKLIIYNKQFTIYDPEFSVQSSRIKIVYYVAHVLKCTDACGPRRTQKLQERLIKRPGKDVVPKLAKKCLDRTNSEWKSKRGFIRDQN